MTSRTATSTVDSAAPATATIGYQTAVSLVLLLLSGIFAGADLLARSQTVAHWFNEHNQAEAPKRHGPFSPRDQFFDNMDYIWMRKLERADYSKGGVELFGSSVAACSLMDWALPADQAALIHNYGYNSANIADTADLIRFVIDHRGMLDAGPDKSLIVLGLTYGDIGNSLEGIDVFQKSVLRSGLYDYDSRGEIIPAPISPFQRRMKTEEMLCRSFLMAVDGLWITDPRPAGPGQFRKINVMRMGNIWPKLLRAQMRAEANLLQDLKRKHVRAVGVLLPVGSWNDGIPARDQFMVQIHQLYSDQAVLLVDCSRIVPDSGFSDSLHCNVEGEAVVHRIILKIALDFLQRSRALGSGAT
jgi:hypothetical protein